MGRMCNVIANYVAPLTKRSMDMCEQQMYLCVSCTWTDCSTRASSLEDTSVALEVGTVRLTECGTSNVV